MMNRNTLLSVFQSGLPLFILSFVITVLFYASAHRAVLIDDGISGIWEIQTEGWKGYINSYGIKGFYYGHYGILALFYSIFHLNSWLWFLLLAVLHALNTTLIQTVFGRCYERWSLKDARMISFFGALLFLLSPFQLENLTWAATLHYNVSLCLLLLMMWLIQEPLMTFYQRILLYSLYAMSLVTLEVSFFFPILLLLLLMVIMPMEIGEKISYLKRKIRQVFLPMCGLFGLYLLAYHTKNHSWIPNREDQSMSIHWNEVVTHWVQFLLKQLTLIHFLPGDKRSILYDLCLHWKRAGIIVLAAATLISGLIYFLKRDRLKPLLYLWTSYVIVSFPFLLFYFMYEFRFENDRYQYFGSVFLLQSLAILFFSFGKKAGVVITSLLVFLYASFIPIGVTSKSVAGRLHENIISHLPRPKQNEHYYFLNLPNYCLDHYEFRANYRLPIALEAHDHQSYDKQITTLMYYYAQGERDRFEVAKTNEHTYELQFKTNGIWWMYESRGASSYENDVWKVNMKEWSVEFVLKRALGPGEKVFLFSDGLFTQVPIH